MLEKETATTRPQTTKPHTTRHLLDLTEDERWRYIEAKEKGDLEVQMKILEGCGCKCSNDDCKCQDEKCSKSDDDCMCQDDKCSRSDDDCKYQDSKKKMIKTEIN